MRTALLCFFAIIATVYSAPTLADCTPPPKCDDKTTPTTPKPITTKKPDDDCNTTVPATTKPTTSDDDCDTTVPVTKPTTVTQTTGDDCTTTPKPTTPKGDDDCDDPPKPHGYKPSKPKSVESVAGAVAGANGDTSFAKSFGFAKDTF
ncbi:salivary glue protein Sgs-3-like isoform X2 [Pieris rapae]|uniref:salivary glue protein Sgs-3-like isoform X2 n=1 Tax=Pieris rapae TaxID=64459 RepID=UPI001E27D78C|nr:salivary glue protein Sgs-3-like isoform X2 [Pieris rapae]